jgi:hypothetical protein
MSEQNHKNALMEKRARALALMLLTRRAELLIEEVKEDIGLDYVVRFHTEGREGLREFCVVVRAAWEALTKDQADKVLQPSLQAVARYGPFGRPVCLFFFTMEDNGAWYTWVAEPVEAEEGKPGLRTCDEPDCRPLDKKALKEIVERVDSWYDVLFFSLSVNGPGRGKAERKQAKQ